MSAVPMGMLTSSTSIQEVQVRVMSVEFVYACLIMARIKTGETRKTRHVANCEGTYVALHAQRLPKDRYEREMPMMIKMLREMWPELPDTFLQDAALGFDDGVVWALVEVGDTYTKTCCGKTPCNHECQSDPRHAWCPARKDLCIDGNFKFLHVTRLADIIPLRFAVRVRPMQGIFRAFLPAAAIPTDSMTGAQLHVWHHTQEVMQGKEPDAGTRCSAG